MQAVILAAGEGRRMRPLTLDKPKPLLPYKGRPLIDYKFDVLPDEVDEVVVAVNYLGEQMREYLGHEHMGRKVTCVDVPMNGTGGGLQGVQEYLGDRFLVMMSDDIYDKRDVEECTGYDFAIVCKRLEADKEIRSVIDKGGYMRGIGEKRLYKSGEGLLVTGLYMLSKSFFDEPLVNVPGSDTEFSLPDTLAKLSRKVSVKIIESGPWTQITKPEDLV